MTEDAVDLRLVLSGLRRHGKALIAATVLGALLGIASVLIWPPMYASSSLVLLPTKAADPNQMEELVKTDIRIAMSDAVLGRAARSLRPSMSVEDLAPHVEVEAATPLVLDIRGRAAEPARAEDISEAVANANVAYIAESLSSLSSARRTALRDQEEELRATLEKIQDRIRVTTARLRGEDPRSPEGTADATTLAALAAQQGRLTLQLQQLRSQTDAVQPSGGASIIQEPSPAKRPGLVARLLGAMLTGALLSALLAGSVITLVTRRDPRLYFRDDIADAVGTPVIASVRSSATSSVAEWISLLHDYSPASIDAWAWRRGVRQLGLTELAAAAENRNRARTHAGAIAVVTLSADGRGLAAGPQLAAYTASAGVRTHLVAAQPHESAAALWAACSQLRQQPEPRPGLSVDTRLDKEPRVDLRVLLAVLDRHEPKLLDLPADSLVVLALSAGSATAEDLARAAVAIDEAGERIHGVVVADPDRFDRTSGRLLQHDRLRQIPLPSRSTGTPAARPPRDAPSDPQRRQG